ncbi:MAG TPA: hypothetical protein VEI02_10890 [Planctomycetota bacterium]|nr:hypothetical protein [Planctomycetota bacterium]
MRTSRPGFGRWSAVLLLACSAAVAQSASKYSDYEWAEALAGPPFGFDDMAEVIFTKMTSDASRSEVEKLQGRMGVANLKRKQARNATGIDSKLKLFDEAVKAIKEVKKEWPDKQKDEYFDVVFRAVDFLQDRGELAMESALDPETDPSKVDSLKQKASSDFTEAKNDLASIREQFKDAKEDGSEAEVAKWRLKNRAWFTYCVMLYSEAMAAKDGSVQQGQSLSEAANQLEEFILHNEDDENVEKMLGALYGQVWRGKVLRASKNIPEALTSFEGPIAVVRWDNKAPLDEVTQGLVELAYFELLDTLNAERRFDDARVKGEELEARAKLKQMTLGVRGRAARVEFARACFETGEVSRALEVAGEIARDGKNDPSGQRATKLIAQIISSTPDKSQFSPVVLLNAARGAYVDRATDATKREEAIVYFRMALPLLGQIKSEAERVQAAAEAWFKYGYCLMEKDLLLEAANAFAEGYRTTWGARKELLQNDEGKQYAGELFTRWKKTAEEFQRRTKSPQAQAMLDEFSLASRNMPPPDTLAFSPGDAAFEEAAKLEKAGKFQEAADKYQEVCGKPPEFTDGLGGRYKERAIVKLGVCRMQVAKRLADKRNPEAEGALKAAVASLDGFLKRVEDPRFTETDPLKLEERKVAQAEARWRISDAYLSLAEIAKDDAAKRAHLAAAVKAVEGFEATFAGQQSLAMFAVANRVEALIALEQLPKAEEEYLVVKKLGADHAKVAETAQRLGKALRDGAEAKKKGLDPKIQQMQIDALKPQFLRAASYYREWIRNPGGQAAKKFDNWSAVAYYFFDAGDMASAAELYRAALDQFGNTTKADPGQLQAARYYLLRANDQMVDELVSEQKDPTRLLSENARLLSDHLMKPTPEGAATAGGKKFQYHLQLDVLRIAGRTWGGFMVRRGGAWAYLPAMGEYQKALEVWNDIYKRAERGSDLDWESTFYRYYLLHKLNQLSNSNLDQVKKLFATLAATTQRDFGGPKWKPWFEWLERQL